MADYTAVVQRINRMQAEHAKQIDAALKTLSRIEGRLAAVEAKLDKPLFELRPIAPLTPPPKNESEEERAERYLSKINKLLGSMPKLSAGTYEFLTGVRTFITRESAITKRQAAVVDRILGENYGS